MLKVYKYEVPFADAFTLDMPMGAQCLSLHNGALWALVDPEAPKLKRRFWLAGTGHPIDAAPADLRFIGTAQFYGELHELHLFEVLS